MKINDKTPQAVKPPLAMTAAPPRWETCSKILPHQADISQFGADGWELVAVVGLNHDPSMAVFHFKRRVG